MRFLNAYLYAVHLAWQIRIFVSAKDNCLFDDCYYLDWCSTKHASWSACINVWRVCMHTCLYIKIGMHRKKNKFIAPISLSPPPPYAATFRLCPLYSHLVCVFPVVYVPGDGRLWHFHLALFHRFSFF